MRSGKSWFSATLASAVTIYRRSVQCRRAGGGTAVAILFAALYWEDSADAAASRVFRSRSIAGACRRFVRDGIATDDGRLRELRGRIEAYGAPCKS